MTNNDKGYIQLSDLKVYQLARELSKIGWEIYSMLEWRYKKIIGDQFIESTDSVGANIAEGYGRFHYLDKIKFYYNSRGSLAECGDHWVELLLERNLVNRSEYDKFKQVAKELSVKLSNFISTTYRSKAQ